MTQTHLGGDSSGPSPSGVGAPGRAQHRGAHAAHRPVVGRAGGHLHPAGGLGALRAHPHGVAARTTSSRSTTTSRRSPRPASRRPACPAARDFGTWFGEFPPFVPFGAARPAVPARLPADLLLLPQGLLPGVLALAAGLRGRRAAREVHRRDPVPADPAERPPLLLLRRDRRLARSTPTTSIRAFHGEDGGFGIGLGTLIMLVNVVLLWAYTAVLPLLPAHHRRPAAALLQAPVRYKAVDLGLEAQRPAHAARLDHARRR